MYAVAQRVPQDAHAYIAPDRILRCTNSHVPREVVLDLPGMRRYSDSSTRWAERQPMIGRPTDYSPVALDDLGLEQQTDYTVEQMTMILGTMYRAVIPLSITTNAVSKTNDICIQRIWDRILKRCPPSPSRAKATAGERGRRITTRAKRSSGSDPFADGNGKLVHTKKRKTY